jgi:hypothetical protein
MLKGTRYLDRIGLLQGARDLPALQTLRRGRFPEAIARALDPRGGEGEA